MVQVYLTNTKVKLQLGTEVITEVFNVYIAL